MHPVRRDSYNPSTRGPRRASKWLSNGRSQLTVSIARLSRGRGDPVSGSVHVPRARSFSLDASKLTENADRQICR
jgi:hypothetical protein